MKKTVLNTLSILIVISLTGCIDDLGKDSSNGSSNLKIEKDFPRSFEITLESKDGTYTGYELYECDTASCESLTSVLNHGANYKGSVKTTCEINGFDGSGEDSYLCTTSWNTSSPVGDPDPIIQMVEMKKDTTYELDLINTTIDETIEIFKYSYN